MLLRGNIRYIKEGLGIIDKHVFVKDFADAEQEERVDRWLVE